MKESDKIYTGKYDVYVYDKYGHHIGGASNLLRSSAGEYADDSRPRHGATYIVRAGTLPNFKKKYRSNPCYRPRQPSTKRPSLHALVGLADRLRKEGDIENADAMVAMVYANRK